MKLKQYFTRSLSHRFISIMITFLVFFLVASTVLLFIHHAINASIITERNQLNKEIQIAQEIQESLNQAFFDARGYMSFNNPDLKNSALAQESKIQLLSKRLAEMADSNEDKLFISELDAFSYYYFIDTLPTIIDQYDHGKQNEVTKMAYEEVTERVTSFQMEMKDYLESLKQESESYVKKMITVQTYTQNTFLIFGLLIFFTLLLIMVKMFRELGRPLTNLASAANKMARGENPSFVLDTLREDEIGELSAAFQRMAEKVHEKEQDLLEQNEELIAQQDELQAQQFELENTLKILQENEKKLKSRNHIINQITNTLNKQEVLDSIVINMCKIVNADKGIIALNDGQASSSFGISSIGVQQFLNHLHGGVYERLHVTKEPFVIKRRQEADEKGYHTDPLYCHDLFLPVLSSEAEIIAVMMFTSYAASYSPSQMEEFTALAKSIGIILEKLSLFEKSEAERKRNQDILNSLQEGVQLIDLEGKMIQTNEYFCNLFHCDSASLLNKTWKEWTGDLGRMVEKDQFADQIKEMLSKSQQGHDLPSLIYTLKQPHRVIKVYTRELYDGEVKLGTVLVHRDITQAFEVDRMKSELVSTVSHELRTPLSGILGFTELLLNRELNRDRQKKYLTTILSEGKRLSLLINDFLDVQKMEAGRQTYKQELVQILPELAKIIEAQQINTSRHQIILKLGSADSVIVADQEKMEQAFTNLIHNAVKYSPNGGKIVVAVREEGKFVKVSVTDHGLGIPEDSIGQIFNKFYRVDNSDRRKIGGTGLGLSIVREIVKAHHGEVTVRSQYGKGSTFTVTFPVAAAQAEKAAPDVQNEELLR